MTKHPLNTAIVLLTKQPKIDLLDFYSKFAFQGYDVFCVVDDSSYEVIDDFGVRIIKIDEKFCVEKNYVNFNPVINKDPVVSAWEKALYYFSFIETGYKNIWFLEDDVFTPSTYPLINVDQKYQNADLVSASNYLNFDGAFDSWSWWGHIPKDILPLPWAHSMVCAVRLSGNLIMKLKEFIASIVSHQEQKPPLLFIEFIFHTLALHERLTVVAAEELSGITWRRQWESSDMNLFTLYHPVKQIELHNQFRIDLSVNQTNY